MSFTAGHLEGIQQFQRDLVCDPDLGSLRLET